MKKRGLEDKIHSAISLDSVREIINRIAPWFVLLIIFIFFLLLFAKTGGDSIKEVGPGGQILYVGLGLLLSLSLTTWEVAAGYSLIDLGPIVILLLLLILAGTAGSLPLLKAMQQTALLPRLLAQEGLAA